MKEEALATIGKDIQSEIRGLCADTFPSIFRDRTRSAIDHFTWKSLWAELVERAPLSVEVLQTFVPAKEGKENIMRPVLCMCLAMILKKRNPKMSMVQSLVSLSLYAGNAGTQVCQCT